MTDEQIAKLEAEASAEFDKGEEAMLVSPLLILGLIEQYRRSERQRHEAARYDQIQELA